MRTENSSEILSTVENGIQKIVLNRSSKKNALTFPMYRRLSKMLDEASTDDSVYIVVMTGSGSFFSSGNDITFSLTQTVEDSNLEHATIAFKSFIDSLIVFPKLLVAIVNGPAIGVATTMLPLFDIVYASEKAYFQTPFTKLGLVAEGCSTYTFPRILGNSKAGDMLYLGYKMSAVEAKERGFISDVYKDDSLDKLWDHINKVSSLSMESIRAIKNLTRKWHKQVLLDVNSTEAIELTKRLESPDLMERFMNFMSRKSKM